MDGQLLTVTRQALHGVAELLLAGPQYELTGSIRLRVTPGGFGTTGAPGLRVEGDHLVTGDHRLCLAGTCAALASAADVRARALRDVYSGGTAMTETDVVEVDAQAARLIADAFDRADVALRAFAPAEKPVLWPEHFDIGIAVGRVNYGLSPGDGYLSEPYAYVGPWEPREGSFWNAPFGATRTLAQLPDAAAIATFFDEGLRAVAE